MARSGDTEQVLIGAMVVTPHRTHTQDGVDDVGDAGGGGDGGGGSEDDSDCESGDC